MWGRETLAAAMRTVRKVAMCFLRTIHAETLRGMQYVRAGFWFAIGVMLAVILGIIGAGTCNAAAEVTIPRAAQQYRATLVRAAHATWGLDAPVAVFAAQVHTESWWRNDTVSHAGAQGLAQVMPATARWLPSVAPETGKPAPFNPGWSLRALCVYDKWLWHCWGDHPVHRANAKTHAHVWYRDVWLFSGGEGQYFRHSNHKPHWRIPAPRPSA